MKKSITSAAILAAAVALSANASVYDENRPIVAIKNGKLQGVEEQGMLAFRNIPYAAPPVGELRWRPPQPAKGWEGVRDASRFGAACIQPEVKGLSSELMPGTEDCLQLNVYAPKDAKDAPVMLWIHGGALIAGSAVEPYYAPINLVKAGVVVVTINYRLGKMGFFAPKELAEEARKNNEPVGNYGVMDQIQALKWVQENIKSFGGNPGNVTIFGQSAGGRSVLWLMTSPAAQGLFHKGIAESAQQTPLRAQATAKDGMVSEEEIDAQFMAGLGVKTLAEARALPADRFLLTPKEFQDGEFGGSIIDGRIILDDPMPLFAAGKQQKLPLMIGTNSWDASFFMLSQPPVAAYLAKMHEDPRVIDKLYADFKYKCSLAAEIMADGWYRGSVKFLADSAGKYAPSYAYYFSYLTPKIRGTHFGAPHIFEIPYVFGSMALVLPPPDQAGTADPCAAIQKAAADFTDKTVWSSYLFPTADAGNKEDQAMSDQMSRSWAAFARTGNPNVDGQVAWPTYNLKDDVMRQFTDGKDQLVKNLAKERVDYQLRAVKDSYGVK